MAKLSPFDFLNSINAGSKGADLFADNRRSSDGAQLESAEKQYSPFMINRGLSYFRDTAIYGNEMNRLYRLPGIMQYDFLRFIVRPGKRFSKWFKLEEEDSVKSIMEAYGYSYNKARQVLPVLSEADLAKIRSYLDKGGTKKGK